MHLVVAIDIGSTYSGYAWQWKSDFHNNRSNVQFNTNWGSGASKMHKTSTCILFKAKQRNGDEYDIEAFGNTAEHLFINLSKETPDDIIGKWYFFKQFKYLLHSKNFHRAMKVEDQNGQCMSLLYVMSKFIEALKNHFIDNLRHKGQRLVMDKTLWVITVPAFWSNEAKNFMQEAVEMSGIKRQNLLLALEPEAAAIYCIHFPEEQPAYINELGIPGQVFLTADLGGLTVDLTAFKVLEDGFLDLFCPAQGELAGGQNVNDAFFQVCHDSFKGNTWKHISGKAKPTVMMNMEDDFERKLVNIGNIDPRAECIELKVPFALKKAIEKNAIRLKGTSYGDEKLKIGNDELTFNSKFIRNIPFKETCLTICNLMKKALKEEGLRECKSTVLVGGFDSLIAIHHIREMVAEYFPEMKVVVPTSPFQAVLKGAVLKGHDPGMIFRSRISRFTDGLGANSLFNEKMNNGKKNWLHAEDDVGAIMAVFGPIFI